MRIESELSLHQLFIKSLKNRPDYKALFEEHEVAFNRKFEELLPMVDYSTVPLETQVRVQTALIFSGIKPTLKQTLMIPRFQQKRDSPIRSHPP